MQRIIILTVMCMVLSFGHAITPENRPDTLRTDYLELVGLSDKAIADMKWAEAIDLIDRAIKLDPANPSNVLLLSNKGMLHHYDGNDSLAIETLTIAHHIAPASVTVLQNRAKVFTSAGMIHEALADYGEVIRADTTLVEPLFYHCMLSFQSTGTPDGAQADLQLMKKRFPDHPSTTLAEASLLTFSGRYTEAIPLLSKLIEAKPTATDLAARAVCYLATGQLPEASEDIARGLELDPTDGELYLYRALLNKMRFRPDDAKADADKARRYGVSHARIKALDL